MSADAAARCALQPDADGNNTVNPLDPSKVKGKIVVCERGTYDRVVKSPEVKRAGGVACPGQPHGEQPGRGLPLGPDGPHLRGRRRGDLQYFDAAGATATASFELGNRTSTPRRSLRSPASPRGVRRSPDGDILKPDISAPGVSVLAAVAPPSNPGAHYDLYSGTSMAAPHITGLAAFLFGAHPTWTPMEMKSAMMTTATRAGRLPAAPGRPGAGAPASEAARFFNPGLFVTSDAEPVARLPHADRASTSRRPA